MISVQLPIYARVIIITLEKDNFTFIIISQKYQIKILKFLFLVRDARKRT